MRPSLVAGRVRWGTATKVRAGTLASGNGEVAAPLFVWEGCMRGFLYRWAIRLKDFGERHNLGVFIWLGLAIRARL
jgi:hypothetical protein